MVKFNFSAFARASEDSDDSVESVTPRQRPSVETRSSGTSDFASPRSAVSGSTGGGASANLPVGLVLVENANQMCCGVIGKDTRGHFCTLPADRCSTKSHKGPGRKFAVQDRTWYVKTPGNRQSAYLDIKCSDSCVERSEDMIAFRNEEKNPEVWRALFTTLINRRAIVVDSSSDGDATTVSALSELGSPTAEDFSKAVDELNSPRHSALGSAVKKINEEAVDLPDLMPLAQALPTDSDNIPLPSGANWDKAVDIVLTEWKKVGPNFSTLRTLFETLGEEHVKLSGAVVKDLKAIEGKASLVDNKILLLKERIGHHAVASEAGTKTVWNAIAEIHSDLDRITESIRNMTETFERAGSMSISVRTLESNLNELKIDYESSMKSLDDLLHWITKKVSALEKPDRRDERNDRFARSRMMELTGDQNAVSKQVDWERRLERVEDQLRNAIQTQRKISTVRESDEAARARNWNGGFGDMTTLRLEMKEDESGDPGAGSSVESLVSFFKSELAFLRGKIYTLEAPNRGQSVEVGGFKFGSIDDCKTFLRRNKLDIGICTDLFTTLVLMGSKRLTGKQKADERHSAKRTDTSVLVNDVFAAMDSSRPEKLYAKGGEGKPVPIADGFGAVPNPKDWHGTGVDGAKHTLSTEVRSYLQGLQGVIGRSSNEGALVARTLTVQTQNHWNEFVGFIEQSQTKLVEVAKFSDRAAWKLIGRYGVALFEAMRPYRASVALLTNPDTLGDQAALLWAILQCHRVMQEFIDLGFEGHPAIVREMSLFMLTERVDPAQLAKVTDENKSLVDTSKVQVKRIKSLEEANTSLKRSLDNLSNEVKQLKAKKT